mgnify:FL=1
MLQTRLNQENLLRQSLMNRLRARVLTNEMESLKRTEKTERRALNNLLDIGEQKRTQSLPTETELKNYLGPLDKHLVENAEIAKRRRKHFRHHSVQLSSLNLAVDDGKARLKSMSLPNCFFSKQTSFKFIRTRVQLCKPTELVSGALHHNDNNETYIDENGIYTTDLCFSEL